MSAYYGIIVGTGIPTGIVGVHLLVLHGTALHVVGEEFVPVSAGHKNPPCVIPVLPCSDPTEIYLDGFISSQLYPFM